MAVAVETDFRTAFFDGGEFFGEGFSAVHGDEPCYFVGDAVFGEELEEPWHTDVGTEEAGTVVCEVVVRMLAGA